MLFLGPGGIIAAFAAYILSVLDIDKSEMLKDPHPRGIGQSGSDIKSTTLINLTKQVQNNIISLSITVHDPVHVLSIPIVSGAKKGLAVFDFYRISNPSFTKVIIFGLIVCVLTLRTTMIWYS